MWIKGRLVKVYFIKNFHFHRRVRFNNGKSYVSYRIGPIDVRIYR